MTNNIARVFEIDARPHKICTGSYFACPPLVYPMRDLQNRHRRLRYPQRRRHCPLVRLLRRIGLTSRAHSVLCLSFSALSDAGSERHGRSLLFTYRTTTMSVLCVSLHYLLFATCLALFA